MESNNENNSQEGGVSSSQETQSNIQIPDNDSFQQSLYIAAISKYIGVAGLHSEVVHFHDEKEYLFTFYQPEENNFFKVFKGFASSDYTEYLCHPSEPFIILDLNDTDAHFEKCTCCERVYLNVPAEISKQIYTDVFTCVYYDGDLWEYSRHDAKTWEWEVIPPDVLRNWDEDEESGN